MSDQSEAVADPVGIEITPGATDDEMAAILAAYQQLWPSDSESSEPGDTPRWRFAGRWWAPRPTYGGWT